VSLVGVSGWPRHLKTVHLPSRHSLSSIPRPTLKKVVVTPRAVLCKLSHPSIALRPFLQCCNTVGWATGRAFGLYKSVKMVLMNLGHYGVPPQSAASAVWLVNSVESQSPVDILSGETFGSDVQ